MSGFWEGQTVYLTGGTGFIGQRMAERMVKGGAELTCLTRDRARGKRLAEIGCTVVEGNVTDPDSLQVPEDVDTVVHGAAWVAYGIPKAKRELFLETNVGGTRNVLQAAKDHGAHRFCHLSSVAAIGPSPAGLYTEERAVEGRFPSYVSLYGESKHKAHLHVLENRGDLEVTLPMPGVVVGLGSDTEALLRSFARGSLWTVRGDNPSPFVHLEDTVAGILAAIEKGSGPYILVDQNLTLHQLVHLFSEASGQPVPGRSVRLGWLKAAASVLQLPYHLRGKVPPLSKELVDQLEIPLTYSSKRAYDELGWRPDLKRHLGENFRLLEQESQG